jgi:outer membrane protein OmpA-like peptidoglycan-associated protein
MFNAQETRSFKCYALFISFALLGLFAGCGTTPSSTAPSTPSASSPPGSPPPKQTLLEEQRRLADLFRGTPVVFSMQPDGTMRIEIPLQFCFDAGQSKVKPPLAAVLDRVSRSQQNEATHISVTAPIDTGAKNQSLGIARAVSIRTYMVAKGVAEARFLAVAVSTNGTLRIVVSNPSAAG